ncbi:hypothetical protein XaCFBP7622_18255 [Xanthomonas arboricola]|nr:hypothetical protein XaCFBP7622_18255 [Xanthomonas arboricola]
MKSRMDKRRRRTVELDASPAALGKAGSTRLSGGATKTGAVFLGQRLLLTLAVRGSPFIHRAVAGIPFKTRVLVVITRLGTLECLDLCAGQGAIVDLVFLGDGSTRARTK